LLWSILHLTIGQSLWPAGPLTGLNSSDHRWVLLTTFFSLFNRSIVLCFSSTLSPCPFWFVFPNNGVNTPKAFAHRLFILDALCYQTSLFGSACYEKRWALSFCVVFLQDTIIVSGQWLSCLRCLRVCSRMASDANRGTTNFHVVVPP
jgi:hypothetical protein